MPLHRLPDFSERVLRAGLRRAGYHSHFHDTSAGRVHFMGSPGRGDLPHTVLLHGFSSNAVHLGGLLWQLRPHVQHLHAPDMLGHGLSERPERMHPELLREGLVETLDHLIDRPAVLFGNSMGGFAALRYALDRPEKVAGLVLVSPTGAAMSEEELHALRSNFHMPSRADALDFVDRLFAHRIPFRRVLASAIHQRFQDEGLHELLTHTELDHFLLPEEVARLDVPTLVIWGQGDRILPESSREFYTTHLPDHVELLTPPTYGHSPYLEHPVDVAQQVLGFLRRLGREAA